MTPEEEMLFMARVKKYGFSSYSERKLYNSIQLKRDLAMIGASDDSLGNELVPIGKLGKTGYEVGLEVLQNLGLLK